MELVHSTYCIDFQLCFSHVLCSYLSLVLLSYQTNFMVAITTSEPEAQIHLKKATKRQRTALF